MVRSIEEAIEHASGFHRFLAVRLEQASYKAKNYQDAVTLFNYSKSESKHYNLTMLAAARIRREKDHPDEYCNLHTRKLEMFKEKNSIHFSGLNAEEVRNQLDSAHEECLAVYKICCENTKDQATLETLNQLIGCYN